MTRRSVVGLAGTVIAVGLAGCADGDGGTNVTTPAGNATVAGTPADDDDGGPMLRVGHMAPGAPAVDVALGGQTVVEGLAFTDVTPYQSVESGPVQVTITPADGGGDPVFDAEVELGEGAQTAVALGELPMDDMAGDNETNATGNETMDNETGSNETGTTETGDGGAATETEFTVELYEDDVELPSEDMAKVRLVHAAPDAPPVSVDAGSSATAGGNETNATGDNATGNETSADGGVATLFEDVAFAEASEYVEAPAGGVTLDIMPADGGTSGGDETNATGTEMAGTGDPVASAQVELDGETVYTVFATGYLSPAAAPVDEEFQLVLAVDASPEMGGTSGTGNETGDNES
ncbi:DUF4397 domain-containing protein [Halobacteriales archaeon Cl-PHB]